MSMNTKPERNAEGYLDLTAYEAICNADRIIAKTKHKNYPRVYVCSSFCGNKSSSTTDIIQYTRFALQQGKFPIVPQLYLPCFIHDGNIAEHELAANFKYRLLQGCRELWLFGRVGVDVKREIQEALRLKIKVRHFSEKMKELTVYYGSGRSNDILKSLEGYRNEK